MKKTFFIFVLVIFAFTSIAYAIPSDPNIFYGKAYINGNPASGTLSVYVNNEKQDSISVSGGVFGGSSVTDDKLVATGKNGDVVKFVISASCYSTNPITVTYEEGKVEYVELFFTGENTCQETTGGGVGGVTNLTNMTNQTLNQTLNQTNQTTSLNETNITAETPPEEEIIEELKDFLNESDVESVQEEVIGEFVPEQPLEEVPQRFRKYRPARVESVILSRIEVKLRTGETRKFIKIEKKVDTDKFVVEIIPKEVAVSSDYIRVTYASAYEVIERDPVLKILPKDGKYAYIILILNETLTEDKVNKITTLVLEELQPPTIPSNQTTPKPTEKTRLVIFVVIIAIILLIIFVLATMRSGKSKKQVDQQQPPVNYEQEDVNDG